MGDNLKEHLLQALKAMSDQYNMYLHEAINELYQKEFITAMVKEVTDQMDNGKYFIIPKIKVKPERPSYWEYGKCNANKKSIRGISRSGRRPLTYIGTG